jgi:hypothetical protein
MIIANRTCAKCGKTGTGKDIHIHHKDQNQKNNALENLIYLCAPCHSGWHRGEWSYKSSGLENTHLEEYPYESIVEVGNERVEALENLGLFRVHRLGKTAEQVIHAPSTVSGLFLMIYDKKTGIIRYEPVKV